MNPSVTRLPGVGTDDPCKRYRIAGGEPVYGPQCCDDAWCEISVWPAREVFPQPHIGSYGGQVWPSAWPHLFEVIDQGWPHGKKLTGLITPLGLELLAAADAAHAPATTPSGNGGAR